MPFLPSGLLAVTEITIVTNRAWKGKEAGGLGGGEQGDWQVRWAQLIQRKGGTLRASRTPDSRYRRGLGVVRIRCL